MKNAVISLTGLLVLFFAASNLPAQNKSGKNKPDSSRHLINIERSDALQKILQTAVDEALEKFEGKNLKPEEIAATVIDLSDANNPKMADFRGEEKIYPASVVKMFYMVALLDLVERGKVKMTPELERGLKEMIEASSNDATHYIFDVITGTSGGAELSPKELEKYAFKKNAVNRYFASFGYQNINVNQKTYCEDIFGRERQFWDGGRQRNKLTTNATARLLANIALGKTVSPESSRKMMDLMKRQPFAETKDKDDQATGFTGIALKNLDMKNARLWSKAGWTSNSRHDAAYIETDDGLKLVVVIFTEKHANERDIIPTVAGKVLEDLRNRNSPQRHKDNIF